MLLGSRGVIVKMFIPFFIAFIISVLIMPLIIKLAKKQGIVDKPGKRKIHKEPIPLLGGLGIFIAFIIPLFIFTTINAKSIVIALSLFFITLLGILDDVYDIKASRKLLVQIICSALVVIFDVRVGIGQVVTTNLFIANAIDIILSIIWIIGIINAINLIDGVDGLAGGVTFISSIGFLLVGLMSDDRLVSLMSSLLAGAVLGFLIYNFYPAKIFMGDAGSTFLGFCLAIISLLIPEYSVNKSSLLAPILILGIPIFETGVSILRRAFMRKNIFEADRKHTHHKLMDMGFSQKWTTLIIYGMASFSVVLGLVIHRTQQFKLGIVFIILYILYGLGISIKEAYEVYLEETITQLAATEAKKDNKLSIIGKSSEKTK